MNSRIFIFRGNLEDQILSSANIAFLQQGSQIHFAHFYYWWNENPTVHCYSRKRFALQLWNMDPHKNIDQTDRRMLYQIVKEGPKCIMEGTPNKRHVIQKFAKSIY